MIVGRENIDFVLGQPDEGLLGLGLSQEEIASGVYLIVGLLFVEYCTELVPTIVQMSRLVKQRRWPNCHKMAAAHGEGFHNQAMLQYAAGTVC